MHRKSVIILVVSREILEGVVVDKNAAFMANRIDDLGYRVRSIQVVDRVEGEMTGAIRWALEQRPTFVIVSGGLGASFDDNTRACVAKATGLPLREDPKALEHVGNSYRRLFARGVVEDAEINADRARMALLPAGADSYENPIGPGPAVKLGVGDTTLFLLPGVPAEMQRIFLKWVVPELSATGPSTVRGERHVDYHGQDESAISSTLDRIARELPNVSFRTRGSSVTSGRDIRITLVAEHSDPTALEEILDGAEQRLRQELAI
ncbi:MAG: competence/damage-inducible protein A [Planctomycetota bacterium]